MTEGPQVVVQACRGFESLPLRWSKRALVAEPARRRAPTLRPKRQGGAGVKALGRGTGRWHISEQNLEIMRRFVEAFNRGGLDAVVDFLDPEIEYREDPRFPQAEVYRGRDAVVRQWREFGASFEGYRFEIEDHFGLDDKVVVVLREVGRGAGSGVPVDRRTGWVNTLRAGKLVRMEIFLDPADALEAVGVSDSR